MFKTHHYITGAQGETVICLIFDRDSENPLIWRAIVYRLVSFWLACPRAMVSFGIPNRKCELKSNWDKKQIDF